MNNSIDFKRFNNHNISTLFLFFLLKKEKAKLHCFPSPPPSFINDSPHFATSPGHDLAYCAEINNSKSPKDRNTSHFVDFWLYYCAHTLIKIRETEKHFCCIVGRNYLISTSFSVNKIHYCPHSSLYISYDRSKI